MSNDQLQQAAPANNGTAAPFSVAQTGIDDRGKRLGCYRSPIDRAVLAQLNRRNDWQPLLHNLGMLAFSAAIFGGDNAPGKAGEERG